MKKVTQIAVIASLAAFSYGLNGSIMKRLNEINSVNLAQTEQIAIGNCSLGELPEPSLGFCDCELIIPTPGGSGAAQSTVYSQQTNIASGQTITQVPNSGSVVSSSAECCACNAENE